MDFSAKRTNDGQVGGGQAENFLRVLFRLASSVLLLVLGAGAMAPALAAENSQPSVAFYYGANVPVEMLSQFDWAVVEADHVSAAQLGKLQQYGTHAFAYVSVGEADHWRGDAEHVPGEALKARNETWNSQAADLTNPAWTNYLVNKRIGPLWQQGYRGFFLDTLDSYRLFVKDEAAASEQQQALVTLIKRLHDEFPGIQLLLNRGFEILDQVHGDIVGVAAESLYQAYDARSDSYRDVKTEDSDWLMNQLARVRNSFGLPAVAIDYVAPEDRDKARATAQRIADAGLIPWVSNGELDQVGVGTIEPMPRQVLVMYNGAEVDKGELAFSNAHLYAAVPLEYLGYGAVYQDINVPLPADTLKGRYAGVVSWFQSRIPETQTYRAWLLRQMNDGVRVAIFGDPGFSVSGELAEHMGVQVVPSIKDEGLAVVDSDALIGFEGMPSRPPINESGFRVVSDASTAHLTMRDASGVEFVPILTGDWGGVALSPWVLQQAIAEQARWVVDPFTFLQRALDLPAMPVPDATTENGSRYWMTQVDGDAFVNRAQFPGSPYTGQVMLTQIFKRYRVPTTVSVIEGELASDGQYPQLTSTLEPIAREIFRLPWVELATHTFSHPFDWLSLSEGELAGQGQTAAGFAYNMPIPGYRYSLEKEVAGSTQYINDRLAPPGKKVEIILWSGDALPPEKALAIADRLGIANMNGGNTHVTNDNPSITEITPMLRPVGKHLQVYAPVINENVYTNDMTGPFWGFKRVIETYRITDSPRRLKPIDLYYHFYSAGQPASLNALKQAYDFIQTQQTLPLYASAYSRIARNWYDAGVARRLDGGWQITGATQARTLRLPKQMGWPDMRRSDQVVGVRDLPQGRYIALSGAPRAVLKLQNSKPNSPFIERANGRVSSWARDGESVRFQVDSAVVPLELQMGGTAGCQIDGASASRSVGGLVALKFSGTSSGLVRIRCDR